MSDDTGRGEACVFRILTLASLTLSAYLILSAIDQRDILLGEDAGLGTISPAGACVVLVVGLLLCGASLYSLAATKGFTHWHKLPWYEVIIVTISALTGAVLTIFVVFAWMLSTVCID